MAEQVSHNVVNGPESASASALADVSANQTTSAPAAGDGTTNEINTLTPDIDATILKGQQGTDATSSAAEPSAGDAARRVAKDPTIASGRIAEETAEFGSDDLVNGVQDANSPRDGLAENGSTADYSVDHSVHSDTDGSRADSLEQKKEGNHHVRTNSVKKPTTFSKVSVTKQFMAKTTTPVPQPPKIGEKPSPVGAAVLSTAKPRLIAKTGSSLQTLQKARLGADSPTGPDASKVWNKNRRTY